MRSISDRMADGETSPSLTEHVKALGWAVECKQQVDRHLELSTHTAIGRLCFDNKHCERGPCRCHTVNFGRWQQACRFHRAYARQGSCDRNN